MPTQIRMPQLGESVVEGTISRWLKQVGDPIAEFEPLLEVSTDKVETEIPAPAAGVLLSIQVQAGETVAKGTLLGVIGAADELHAETTRVTAQVDDNTQPMRAVHTAAAHSGNGGWHVTPVVARMAAEHSIDLEVDPHQGVFRAAEGDYELVIVSMGLRDFDSLRLCSQIRSLERTRQVPILVIADPAEEARLVRALDLGVNDYVTRPIDRNELVARVRTQIRRYRYTMQLRETFHQSVEMAVTDPLTGLYNRRYMESHLAQLSRHAAAKSGSLSMLLVDIDYFKAINDTYGHDAGDEVLREFATRLRTNARGVDLVCRFGGEEFVVIMPDTELSMAYVVAERMRAEVAAKPFPIRGGSRAINATISIGVATLDGSTDTPAAMMKRADDALYSAKRDGRNRVVANAA